MKLTGDYLGEYILLCRSIETWPCHIDRFTHYYDKELVKYPLFGVELINRVHYRVQVFLHCYNKVEI